MANPITTKLRGRIAAQKEALETFARLHRELIAMREGLTLPEAQDRVDVLLGTNAEVVRGLHRELAVSLALLRGCAAPLPSAAVHET